MRYAKQQKTPSGQWVQLLIVFVIPIIILTRLSGESQLGATKALLLALAFPIVYELFSIFRYRKASVASLLSIGGIIVTGTISLLGLSEEWLAVRRSAPYLVFSIALLGVIAFKRSWLQKVLPYVFDTAAIESSLTKKHMPAALDRTLIRAGYMVSALLFLIAGASYFMTKAFIDSPTNSAQFNQEYAALRIASIPAITLPLIVGIMLILFYLVSSIEKLTGLSFEQILKKK